MNAAQSMVRKKLAENKWANAQRAYCEFSSEFDSR
jgi:hypothetical protein